MNSSRTRALTLCTLAVLGATAAEVAPNTPDSGIVVQSRDGMSEVEVSTDASTATARNGVVIKWMGSTLSAKTVAIDNESGSVQATGDVVIDYVDELGTPQRWKGSDVQYDFRRRRVVASGFRMGRPPFFVSGKKAEVSAEGGQQNASEVVLTTDDVAEPGYRIRAKSLTIQPDKTLVAENAVLYVGKVPMMYFPKYTRTADRHPNFWTVTPGYRSLYGPFVLGSYHWEVRTNVTAALDLDLRQRRGVAGGPQVAYDLGNLGQGGGRFYYLHDEAPELSALNGPIDPDRYRFDFRHSVTNDSGFEFKGILRGQSDSMVWRDFFEREFRKDPQPKTFAEVSKSWSDWSLDLLAQPQVNDFFRTVERLPDVRLKGFRQAIGVTPVFYESESSLAYLRYRDALPGGTNFAAFRADSYHQILAPQTYLGWLNVTPRAGGRFTHYGDVEGDPALAGGRDRWVLNTGVDVGTKASRIWPSISNRALDLEGVRHIVEPTVSYVYVPRPDQTPVELPQFDRELITPRLLPIHFPDYSQIDSVDSQNTLRLGLRNKVQTKRGGEVQNLVNWSVMTDWRLRPRVGQTTFADIYSDLDFSPRRWITLTSETRFDIDTREFRESNHRLTLTPNEWVDWSFGHRYLRDDFGTYGIGNNVFFSSLFLKFNENWGARAVHQFESRDGVLEEQQYQIYRDLRSWTAALGVRLRDNRGAPSDWTIGVTFSLKAFPRFGLGEDRSNPNLLLGM